MRILAALMLALSCAPALACRCKALPLADYYAQARTVQIAKLISSREVGLERILKFRPLTSFKPLEASLDAVKAYRTGGSSASCGVIPRPGATYVLFAQALAEVAGPPRIDSCSGSRVIFMPDAGAGRDFLDVPLRFVPQQLLALAGVDALRSIRWPRPTDPENTSLIGLLDLARFAHAGSVTLYAEPHASAARIATIDGWDRIVFRQSGYEVQAAVVFAEVDGWYRLRLADGRYGWLAPQQAGTYFAYAQLVPRRLNYLTAAWNGLVWPQPGAGLPFRHQPGERAASRAQHPARVLNARHIADSLWFQVEILDREPCGSRQPRSVGTGWIPAYDDDGQATAWYHPRGC